MIDGVRAPSVVALHAAGHSKKENETVEEREKKIDDDREEVKGPRAWRYTGGMYLVLSEMPSLIAFRDSSCLDSEDSRFSLFNGCLVI